MLILGAATLDCEYRLSKIKNFYLLVKNRPQLRIILYKDMEGYSMDELKRLPIVPDKYWPEGAAPTHLSPSEQRVDSISGAYEIQKGPMWQCKVCKGIEGQSIGNPELCRDCFATQSQNMALARKTNANWMEEAKELGIALFERQPEETDTEWRIWEAYRSYYPLKLPTYSELAKQTGHGVPTVVKAASKWSYKVRLIAWSKYTDADIQAERVTAIRAMNQKQLRISENILSKLERAVELLDPAMMRPGEITSMFKVATDLEQKITTYVAESVANEDIDSKRQTTITKAEDLNEVVKILQEAGVLGKNSVVGIEQTTRVIAKGAGTD